MGTYTYQFGRCVMDIGMRTLIQLAPVSPSHALSCSQEFSNTRLIVVVFIYFKKTKQECCTELSPISTTHLMVVQVSCYIIR